MISSRPVMKSLSWIAAAAITLFLFGPVTAQSARKISLRTLCFQHVDNIREVYLVSGSKEKPILTPVKLFTSTYSDEVVATVTGGRLVFAVQDKNEEGEDFLRTVAEGPLAAGARQVAVFLPSGGKKTPYRLKVIDETEKKFPMGSTLIYNLTSTKARFTIGEHKKELKPGALGLVPLPTKTNNLNQCTVRVFLTDKNGDWKAVSSTVWKASAEMRSLALAYIHPRSKQPTVQCLQETPPWKLPQL